MSERTQKSWVQEPDCDRSACGDFSPGPCDNPECPALRTTPLAAQTNDFKPSWKTVKAYEDRLTELLDEVQQLRVELKLKSESVELTDEEIQKFWRAAAEKPGLTSDLVKRFARAIEAKLKEKAND